MLASFRHRWRSRTSYLASYLAARKPPKRQPDIYQAVFKLLWGSFETRLLLVHPSLVTDATVARSRLAGSKANGRRPSALKLRLARGVAFVDRGPPSGRALGLVLPPALHDPSTVLRSNTYHPLAAALV